MDRLSTQQWRLNEGYSFKNGNANTNPVNQTLVLEFVLTGYPCNLQIRIFQFIVFLSMYILSILGNSLLIITIIVSPQLHTAMYYFLCNLSVIDLCLTSCSLPKMLLDIFSTSRKISYIGCLIQIYFSLNLGGSECFLLSVMAYDRYVAICHPLHYTTIMSWRVCRYCTLMILLACFSIFLLSEKILKPLDFCKGNRMDHFVCEFLGLLDLACGDVSTYKLLLFYASLVTLLCPFVFIIISYICIIISILKIKSAASRSKTFSTCASHLTVVLMYYGTNMTAYMGQGIHFSSKTKYISLIYGVFTPVLNPVIYSLRNNEVKKAFSKILRRHLSCFKNSPGC